MESYAAKDVLPYDMQCFYNKKTTYFYLQYL